MSANTPAFETTLKAAIDGKTKPLGALGRIEILAARIARIQGTLKPRAETCSLTIFAGDHGMAKAGVSAFPQDVTRQMVANFLSGGAAANIFAKTLDISVAVVDAGVAGEPIRHPALIDRKVASGTANAIEEPAMTDSECRTALDHGLEIGRTANTDAVCFGEMGIGNTSSASLLAAKLTGQPVDALIGAGTGLNDAGLLRKRALLETAASRMPPILEAEAALREYGGFEIAMMTGAMIGAAEEKRIVIVDGFIAGAAALCARAIAPDSDASFIYGHRSAEAGHARVLETLNASPLLDLGMRLGEGTGALLAWPLVKAAAAMLCDMASFESAGVSGPSSGVSP